MTIKKKHLNNLQNPRIVLGGGQSNCRRNHRWVGWVVDWLVLCVVSVVSVVFEVCLVNSLWLPVTLTSRKTSLFCGLVWYKQRAY